MADEPRSLKGWRNPLTKRTFVADSSVLIDYLRVEPEVLRLIARHLGNLLVPEPIIDETDNLDDERCIGLEMEISQPLLEEYTYASLRPIAGLKPQDHICLLVASRLGAVCITSDKRLREVCLENGVIPLWGLRPMVHLVKKGVLPPNHAIRVARQISKTNPFITSSILSRFELQLAPTDGTKQRREKKRKPRELSVETIKKVLDRSN